MFLVNSRYPLVTATPFGSRGEPFHLTEVHLLPKLRCQFAEFLRLGSLKRLRILTPPTCVGLRYELIFRSTRNFSWKHGITNLIFFQRKKYVITSQLLEDTFNRISSVYELKPRSIMWLSYPSSSLLVSTLILGAGILTCFPSFTPIRPQLRSRLTLGGLTLPRNPWVFGENVSHIFYRYSLWHTLS